MDKKSVIVVAIVSLIIGLVIGYFIYAKTSARFTAVTTACVIVNQAVDQKLLSPEQVKQLGQFSGKELKAHYASVANKLAISDQQANAAAAGSQCSQFLLAIHQSS